MFLQKLPATTTFNNRADSSMPTTNPKGMLTTPKRKASKYTLRRFCPFVAPILDNIPICLIRSCKEMEKHSLLAFVELSLKGKSDPYPTRSSGFIRPPIASLYLSPAQKQKKSL